MKSHEVLRGVLCVAFFIVLFQLCTWGARQILGEGVVCNAGGVFGFAFPVPMILIFSLGIIVFFIREWIFELESVVRWTWTVIIASGLSNLWERLFFGCVHDYVKLPFLPYFNFADLSLTLAVVFFLWYSLMRKSFKKDS